MLGYTDVRSIRVGAQAYPDMLQVGNLPNFEQNRAHFGAWVIISAPLYLGFDLRNTSLLQSVWPILGNEEAIAINQQYAGHPGMRVKAWTPSTPAIEKYYIVTGSIGHTAKQEGCSKGWKVNKENSNSDVQGFNVTISTPPIPTASGDVAADAPGRCLAYVLSSERVALADEDDGML